MPLSLVHRILQDGNLQNRNSRVDTEERAELEVEGGQKKTMEEGNEGQERGGSSFV